MPVEGVNAPFELSKRCAALVPHIGMTPYCLGGGNYARQVTNENGLGPQISRLFLMFSSALIHLMFVT